MPLPLSDKTKQDKIKIKMHFLSLCKYNEMSLEEVCRRHVKDKPPARGQEMKMSVSKMTVCLKKIDWLLPNGALSVRIAAEKSPGSISHGPTSSRNGGRRTGPPASVPLTLSAATECAPIPVSNSRCQPSSGCRRHMTRGLAGRKRRCKRRKGPFTKNLRKLLSCSNTNLGNPFESGQVGSKIPCVDLTQNDEEIAAILHQAPSMSQPEPCSPALSSTSFLYPSPVPSSFASSPPLSPSVFMDSPPPSPCVASPVSPAPGPSSVPVSVHPTPLCQVPAQDTDPSPQLVPGPTPPFISPSVVIEKMERFNWLHKYYLDNYCKMTYEARCFAYQSCQQLWIEFLSAVDICKQWRNRNSNACYSYSGSEGAPATRRHSTHVDEAIFADDELDQLSVIPGVLEMAAEMGCLSEINSYMHA
ncbi:uncharacterized protein [Paramormyrops kingsleyae]|uniref:uncharacterized protein n=1 Tax=Paramormyrops kingsleyae TaxID=1676925 RepID=UPI003B975B9F